MIEIGPVTVYPPAQAAKRLHQDLSPRTLERWRQTGHGPAFVRIGRRIGYTESALMEWLQQQTRRHSAEGR